MADREEWSDEDSMSGDEFDQLPDFANKRNRDLDAKVRAGRARRA